MYNYHLDILIKVYPKDIEEINASGPIAKSLYYANDIIYVCIN